MIFQELETKAKEILTGNLAYSDTVGFRDQNKYSFACLKVPTGEIDWTVFPRAPGFDPGLITPVGSLLVLPRKGWEEEIIKTTRRYFVLGQTESITLIHPAHYAYVLRIRPSMSPDLMSWNYHLILGNQPRLESFRDLMGDVKKARTVDADDRIGSQFSQLVDQAVGYLTNGNNFQSS